MSTIQFYHREDLPAPGRGELEAGLTDLGATLEGDDGAPYRPGRWRCTDTGAQVVIDLGNPHLVETDHDHDHPPTTYPGWQALPLVMQVPLIGPHWHAVEAFTWIGRLLERLALAALDLEDNRRDDEGEPGPYGWDRPRLILSWERQRSERLTGRTLPRLSRATSVAVWRYRRERAAGAAQHRQHHWPEALVLLPSHGGDPRPACLWAGGAIALPPVEIVVATSGTPRVVEITALRGRGQAALGGALLLDAEETAVLSGAPSTPVSAWKSLGDEDWID